MPTADVNGVRLFHALTGESGPPLVLIHGAWGDHRDWDPIVPTCADHFKVLAYDRRGHSQSARSPDQDSIDEDVADLAALIEALGLAPAHIAGFSFGGAIALRLAIQRPDLVRSAAVHEPPIFATLTNDPIHGPAVEAERARLEAVAAQLATGDDEGGARQFFETFFPGAWEAMPPADQRSVVGNAPTFLGEIRDPGTFTIDVAALAACQRPVLLTFGGESPAYWQALIGKLAAVLPRDEIQCLAGVGHVPIDAHPTEYAAVIATFANVADAAGSG